MTSLLSRLLRKKPVPTLSHLTFTLYSRPGCTCCQTALTLLQTQQRLHGFQINQINVDSSPPLAALYGPSVPVITLNGKVRFKSQINPPLLTRLLLAESRISTESPLQS